MGGFNNPAICDPQNTSAESALSVFYAAWCCEQVALLPQGCMPTDQHRATAQPGCLHESYCTEIK